MEAAIETGKGAKTIDTIRIVYSLRDGLTGIV
jgi:hypothetical protein